MPGLQLIIPKQCLTDDVAITLTVYYLDPPYSYNLYSEDDDVDIIYLSPIIRLEPDGYLFNCQQSFNVVLQLPIPSVSQLYQHFRIKNIRDLALQLAQRRQFDNEWHIENIVNQPTISIANINDICCVSIPIYHFSDYLIFVKSIYSFVSKYIYPSLQQQVAAMAYLSRIDAVQRMVNLKIILIRNDADKARIEKNVGNKFPTSLICEGLEETIMENGLYKIKFDKCGLECKHNKFMEQDLEINWNERDNYQFLFKCNILLSIDQLLMIADIIIEPVGNQTNKNLKILSLMMVCVLLIKHTRNNYRYCIIADFL